MGRYCRLQGISKRQVVWRLPYPEVGPHLGDRAPENHTQVHLRYASSLVQLLRHKRTRRTAGGNQAEVISEARFTELEAHPPVHAHSQKGKRDYTANQTKSQRKRAGATAACGRIFNSWNLPGVVDNILVRKCDYIFGKDSKCRCCKRSNDCKAAR